VSRLDTRITLFGQEHAFPILLGPVAGQKLAHPVRCYTVPSLLRGVGYSSFVNRWAMTNSGHHGTVRFGEHRNQSSSCYKRH
jgi:hypothetical protein